MLSESERKVYEILKKLDISYIRHEHPPVFTVEEAERYWQGIRGAHCKNLFLRNKKGNRHYLVIIEHTKRAGLKELEGRLGEDRLSFASEDRLNRYLGLKAGSVSPFGLISDSKKEVKVIIDQDLRNSDRINFHPNVNTATVEMAYSDFEKFLSWAGNSVRYLKL